MSIKIYDKFLRPRQSLAGLHSFYIPTRPSSAEYEKFCDDSLEYCQKQYPYSVPGKLEDGTFTFIPVTEETPHESEDIRHHLVVLVRESDGAEAELVVEEHTGYVKASRVVYLAQAGDRNRIPFCFFGDNDEDLPARFYMSVNQNQQPCLRRTQFQASYKHLEKVQVYEGVLDIIFSFLEELQLNPMLKNTADRELLLDTLFVLIAEGRRFRFMKFWIMIRLVTALSMESLIPLWFIDAIQDWSNLCKCVLQLFLAMLEEGLRSGHPGDLMEEISNLSMGKAISLWEIRQSYHQNGDLVFFEDKVPLKLHSLSGGVLSLLKHEEELCGKIMLRLRAYNGRWLSEIPID